MGPCFKAGDIRANEIPTLTPLHVVMVREHNRIATALASINPHRDKETLCQQTKKIVGALFQHITFAEYLPSIAGKRALDKPIQEENLMLQHGFFQPWRIIEQGGIDPIIRGLFAVGAKDLNSEELVSSALTEHLFETSDRMSLDLEAMDIQRGRDHGFLWARDGDRFWYENPGVFTDSQLLELKKSSLARVICDNTGIGELPSNVFRRADRSSFKKCEDLPEIDLEKWRRDETDKEAPKMKCPEDIVFKIPPSLTKKEWTISWDEPYVLDNVDDSVTVVMSTCRSGDAFPEGVTKVTYSATDSSGNCATCSFSVVVTSQTSSFHGKTFPDKVFDTAKFRQTRQH
ncbi:thyroid peroxidase-like [Ptychodera flava]|uniref:thyroid peroxidase-like n=1 Tax=Ptychodera flava TaxID=63121 RepID=UPI00396A43C7